MTFLTPVPALIAAALTIPALVVFYLLKLRRRPVRVSSTLLWQKATHDLQVNTPLRWLRPSWLFFLQLLALLAFLTALGRPAIPGDEVGADIVVLVIDRSASMSARDGRDPRTEQPDGSTRLDEAKRRAELVIDQLARRGSGVRGGGQARAMVVSMGADARSLTTFTGSASLLRDAVRSVPPSDQPVDFPAALRLLGSIGMANVGDTEEEAPPERMAVYIFSDGAFPPPAGGGPFAAPGLGWSDVRLVGVGPRPARQEPTPAAGAEPARPANLGIVAVSARRDHDDPAVARIFVRVQNAGTEPVSTVLELRIDETLVQTRPVDVPGTTATPDGGEEVGQAAVTFQVDQAAGGVAVVSIPRPDLLAADNAAAIVLGAPARPAVLLVSPGRRPDPFLMSVLEEMSLGRLIFADAEEYEARARLGGGAAAESLSGFDLIVFDRVRPRTLPPVASLSFGATVPLPGLGVSRPGEEEEREEAAEPDEGRGPARFLAWRRTHPVLRYVPLDHIVIDPAMVVSLPGTQDEDAAGATPPGGAVLSAVSLAEGPDGPLIALVEQTRARRIVVGFDLARSTLGPDVAFPVFMANAVDYLAMRGQGVAGRAFRTDEAIGVRPAPGVQSLRITGPLTATVAAPEAGAAGGRPEEVSIGVLDRAGVYGVEGAVAADSVLAVNLADANESRVRTAATVDIAGTGGGRAASGPAGERDGESGLREIWQWFVLAGLVLLSVEWLLYAWRMRP